MPGFGDLDGCKCQGGAAPLACAARVKAMGREESGAKGGGGGGGGGVSGETEELQL